jgi:hypothetical protein
MNYGPYIVSPQVQDKGNKKAGDTTSNNSEEDESWLGKERT